MIRVRFKTESEDCRPVSWPIKHPYWVTGYGDNCSIIVAYADNEAEVMSLWPEAYDLDSEIAENYTFTDRFLRPDWMQQ